MRTGPLQFGLLGVAREFDRVPDDRLEFLGSYLAGIRQIDLVMAPILLQIDHVTLLAREGIHGLDRGGLIIVAADVQTLDAQPLVHLKILGD